jgi:hypothetical protein
MLGITFFLICLGTAIYVLINDEDSHTTTVKMVNQTDKKQKEAYNSSVRRIIAQQKAERENRWAEEISSRRIAKKPTDTSHYEVHHPPEGVREKSASMATSSLFDTLAPPPRENSLVHYFVSNNDIVQKALKQWKVGLSNNGLSEEDVISLQQQILSFDSTGNNEWQLEARVTANCLIDREVAANADIVIKADSLGNLWIQNINIENSIILGM